MPEEKPSADGSSNYDDIVRQLHSKTSRHKATREVVVDAKSGEKKIRVRQKRRSSKSQKRGRATASETIAVNRFINILIALMVIAGLSFAAIWFVGKGRYESPAFSQGLTSQLSERLPGTVSSSNWRVSFNNIRLGQASYEGAATESLQEAKFRGFETSLPVNEIIRGGEIQLDFLQVEKAEILLRRPQQRLLNNSTPSEASGGWESPLPQSMGLDQFQITSLSARFAGQDERNEENEVLGLSGASLDYDLLEESFSLRDGTLRVPGWPIFENFDIEGSVSDDASKLEISQLSTTVKSTSIDGSVGYLEATGSISWRGVTDSVIEFNNLATRPIPIRTLLPETSPYLNKIRGSMNITLGELIIPAQGEYVSPQLKAEVEFVDLSLRRIRLFENLGRFAGATASKFFASPQYETASAELELKDGLWELKNINLRYLDEETGSEVVMYGDLSWSERQPPQGEFLLGLSSNFFTLDERQEIRETEGGKELRSFHWQERADTLFYTRLNVGGELLELLSSKPASSQLNRFNQDFPRLTPSTDADAEEAE